MCHLRLTSYEYRNTTAEIESINTTRRRSPVESPDTLLALAFSHGDDCSEAT
jgi:hypothetical protein